MEIRIVKSDWTRRNWADVIHNVRNGISYEVWHYTRPVAHITPAPTDQSAGIECPCCGMPDAFKPDEEGCYGDGQESTCGCPSWITFDGDIADATYDDETVCPVCEEEQRP